MSEHSSMVADGRAAALARVSRAMVRLYKEQFGRGPTFARSNWAGDDMLVCELRDTFTPAERNLAEMGEHQRLRDVRMFFQYATEDDFRRPVEEITGRKVIAFISGIDTRIDVSLEAFVLEPSSRHSGDLRDAGSLHSTETSGS